MQLFELSSTSRIAYREGKRVTKIEWCAIFEPNFVIHK